mmetsp:Transcript_3510/g.5276  ORF Transcript_3510/g.5276 Transcript_3510/m.5276 type:complete len:260 (+) Transcript_3510:195-974(+)
MPIQVTLVNTPHAKREYAEFTHRPGEKYYDFHKVREEIELYTDRICGRNKDVSHQPILMKIYSQKVVDLTLVDLPGMTKVPTGNQPLDIEQKILEVCTMYTRPKSAIIMAVIPANNDLANADSLKLARKVDPMGDRTIGVLTKLDLMDEGTNAMEIIRGKVYPLRLGYIPVVCRSQKDIMEGKTLKEGLGEEERFFKTHEVYASMSNRAGIPYLCRQLSEIIVRHIKSCLPVLRSKISSLLFQKEKELKTIAPCADVAN